MSKRRITEVRTERKRVRLNESEKLVDLFTDLYPGVHFLDMVWEPFEDLPSDLPELEVVVVSYRSSSHFGKHDRASYYATDVKPEITRERKWFSTGGRPHHVASYIISFTTSHADDQLASLLRSLGFRYERKHLHVIILAVPPELGTFMFNESRVILDRFEFDRSELMAVHKKKLRILAHYMRATWEKSQPSDKFMPVDDITIIGHTDRVGDREYNKVLGQERADSVAAFLRPRLDPYRRSLRIGLTTSDGENDPRVETEEAEELNRGAEIKLTYHDDPVANLLRVKEIVLTMLEDDDKVADTDFYDEAKCIAEKLDAFSFEDLFYAKPGRHSARFSHHRLLSLRIILLREKYRGSSDEKLYRLYKKTVIDIGSAIRFANRRAVDIAGIVAPDHPNQAKRKDFAFQRICNEQPPSILECLNKSLECP
ncbi:MAG: OmpA family protein [Acidimicrobiia bacterium]